MEYKYKRWQLFGKRLNVPKNILNDVYNSRLSCADFFKYKLDDKIPLSCLWPYDKKIIDKIGKEHPDQIQLLSAVLGGAVNKLANKSTDTGMAKDGILQGYMQDKLNARLMGVKPTGNGRRESYAHLPMPRMTNTYMLAGQSKFEDLVASVDRGIYAPHFGGGQVDITSGKFVFSTSEAYLIEKGKITKPVKGATLIGSGIDVMQKVSMVADETDLDLGIGVCGKDGQSVPVGVGQPALKIDEITVGGTN